MRKREEGERERPRPLPHRVSNPTNRLCVVETRRPSPLRAGAGAGQRWGGTPLPAPVGSMPAHPALPLGPPQPGVGFLKGMPIMVWFKTAEISALFWGPTFSSLLSLHIYLIFPLLSSLFVEFSCILKGVFIEPCKCH